MVALVPAKQWHTCVPAATHLFSPPVLRLCPSIWTRPPVLHRTLSPSPTNAVPLFLFFFSLSLPTPIGQGWHFFFIRTKEMATVTKKEERQLDRHGLEIVLHLHTYHTLSLLSVSSFLPFSASSPFPVFWHFHLLPLPLAVLVSSLTFYFHLSLQILSATHLISHTTYPTASISLGLTLFFLFVSVCSRSTMWSEPLQWIISQLTHRGQPNPPVQTWDNIQMIGWLALERGSKPPYQLEPGSVHRSAHKAY